MPTVNHVLKPLSRQDYFSGLLGRKKNHIEAFHWFKRAADGRNRNGMFNLAVAYYDGEGVEKNLPEAFSLYRRAAGLGHVSAMSNLAGMYQDDQGLPQDLDKKSRYFLAKHLAIAAAEGGESDCAMNALAQLYEEGEAASQNTQIALYWYDRAAQAGSAAALFNMGRLLTQSSNSKDHTQGIAKLRQAAEKGDVDSMMLLAKLYQEGNRIEKNLTLTLSYLDQARQAGHAEAEIRVLELLNPTPRTCTGSGLQLAAN